MRLLDAEDSAGLRLREPACFDDFVDLQREPRLKQFLLRVRQAEIGKDIAAAFFHACSGPLCHVSSVFPCGAAPLPRSAAGSVQCPTSAWQCHAWTSSGIRAV